MKKELISIVLIVLSQTIFGQINAYTNKKEIQQVLTSFMQCLVKKDSIKFYDLFHTEPVVWKGITHKRTFDNELKNDSNAKDNFKSNYKSFYRHFYNKQIEEKFYDIQILENGYIASVSFKYSFWENGKKTNWGMENWGLIKADGQWKITSVIFSTEDDEINPEPRIPTLRNQNR